MPSDKAYDVERRLNNLIARQGPLLSDPWHNVGSFANGWGSAASPVFQYRWSLDGRSVLLTGQATPGTTTDGTTVATLPAGYRPGHNQWVIPRRDNSTTDTDVAFRIDSGGVMTCFGIVATTTLVSFNTSFAIDT
jgi:hypothetical protein